MPLASRAPTAISAVGWISFDAGSLVPTLRVGTHVRTLRVVETLTVLDEAQTPCCRNCGGTRLISREFLPTRIGGVVGTRGEDSS
jgi:hypothetical protein